MAKKIAPKRRNKCPRDGHHKQAVASSNNRRQQVVERLKAADLL